MHISGKTLRNTERAIHLAMGIGLLLLSFSPLGHGELGGLLRLAVAPFVVASGILMWQHARVTRAIRSSDRLPIHLS
jgi:hypothetical protein